MKKLKDITNFREHVKYLSQNKIDLISANGGVSHAKIVVSEILLTAKEKINAYITNFDQSLYESDSVIYALQKFLEREDVELNLMYKKDSNIEKCETFYKMLKESKISNIKNTSISLKISEAPINFITADGEMYRLEKDIKNHSAIFNFNDPNYTNVLNGVFSNYF